ncbi:SusC/RagA family TonB-linked outer membrane protein [Bacteroides sp. OttesenSCG-928-D19]|nr:SusC/RagA family TonB-linked outer membrane protein [Bacteroides sp. OttesenSCG-928-D19]
MGIFCFFVSGLHAQITLNASNKTIKSIIETIEKNNNYSFFYTDKLPDLDKKVSIRATNESIESVLNRLFKDSDIAYRMEPDNQIVLNHKLATERPVDNTKKITGVITDNQGDPLIGATVTIADSDTGTITDIDGKFELEVPVNTTLNITYVGYEPITMKVTANSNYTIVLKEDTRMLDEVVIVGYGAMKRKDITTAVSVISTEDIDKRPLMSAAQAIQGKAAGIQVVQPSGQPGEGLSIRVRGATSVQASNEPLYVVDGMPTDNISYMSPNDVESIQVLKDASSAAIYGARAANGVVLITTKRGKKGEVKVKLSAYTGISQLGKKIDALNTEEYKELMKDLKKVTNTVPNIPEDERRYVDWTDAFFKTGVNQNYQISVANGTDKVQYLVSGGYSDEDGIVRKAKFNRYNFRANVDSQQTSWLNMSLNFSYSKTKGQWINSNGSSLRSGSILSVINTPPFMQQWDPKNPEQYDELAYGSRILNPLAANAPDNITSTDFLKGSIGFTIDLYKGLKWKTTFGIDTYDERWHYYMDPTTTAEGRASKGRVEESFAKNTEWLMENLLTYDTSFHKHNLSVMGGATQQHAQYNGQYMVGFDLSPSYPDLHSINAANQIDKDLASSSGAAWALASFLGRVAYNYDSKYLFTANFRADGSSRFAPGHRWGYFPSLSAGWRISSEKFMEGLQEQITDMKIRIGWGMNGNQSGIGNYSYLASMYASRVPATTENQYPGMAVTPNTAANKELTWEKTTQWNAGLDMLLFDSRISITLDAYYKKTTDLLLTVSLPDNVNLPGGITRNDGTMINKGMELQVSTQNFKGPFSWDTDFNISFNRNKLTKLGLNKVYYYAETYETKERAVILKEGLALGTFYGYISEGVDPETGDIIYTDLNNNGETDPGDRTTIGCAQPDFIYGMTNTFSYKGFSLSVFLQGSQGNDIFNASKIDMESMTDFRNQSKQVLHRWKRPGMITHIPRVGNTENIHNSTRFVEDGSYLRLKTVSLSYNFNREWLKKLRLSKLQLYATAQNLLTFTNYKGYDPEVNAYGSSAVAQGVDYGTYPQSKSIVFGLNVEF